VRDAWVLALRVRARSMFVRTRAGVRARVRALRVRARSMRVRAFRDRGRSAVEARDRESC
jgi:hypothetical protein